MPNLIIKLLNIPFEYLRAAFTICTDRKLLSLCLIPYLIGFIVFLVLCSLSFFYRHDLAALFVSEPNWIGTAAAWGLFLINIFISALLAVVAALTLGAFYIESFIAELLNRKALLAEGQESIVKMISSTLRSLKDDVLRLIYILIFTILIMISGFFPPLAAIPVALGCFLIGLDIIDLPLVLLEIPFKDRWSLAKQHFVEITATGAVFSLILFIPLGGIFFMPVAYYVGVTKVAEWDIPSRLPGTS
jgi:CysZ protein